MASTRRGHGTWTRWCTGCRCEPCGIAAREYRRDYLKRVKAEGGLGPHGTRYRYVTGCRCDECRKANSTYDRELRQRRAAESEHGTPP